MMGLRAAASRNMRPAAGMATPQMKGGVAMCVDGSPPIVYSTARGRKVILLFFK